MAKRNKKRVLGGIFIASMAVIGVGYAALSNINLKIIGTATVGPNTEAFNVRLTNVYDNDNPVKCTLTSDTTATCTANMQEAYDYEDLHNSYGNVRFDVAYDGSDDLNAKLYPIIKATGNTENITVGAYSNFTDYVYSGWSKSNPVMLSNGETKYFNLALNSADAKIGDEISFELNIVAEPVQK